MKRIITAVVISLIAFLAVLMLTAQLWVAIFFPVHMRYNVVNVFRAEVPVAPIVAPPVPHHAPHGQPIVEGGITTAQGLWRAIHDPAIAESFAGFDFATARLVELNHSVLAFVSYRLDGRGVFWTVSPVLIQRGEMVWVDKGGNMLRVRCGNRIAFAPGTRVAPSEETPDTPLTYPEAPGWHPVPGISTTRYTPITPVGSPGGPIFLIHSTSGADNPAPSLIFVGVLILFAGVVRWRMR
jgi:hypothetical protein